MAFDKVVDSAKLNSAMSVTADAIRGKTGSTDSITWDESIGFADAIRGIITGGGVPSEKSVEEKDINFYDYDGTLLYSYTVEEAQALVELPTLPEQPGLICQEWNWNLEDLKALGRKMDVGATYITDDGATRLYLNIPLPGRLTVPLNFTQTAENGVTIDWGDGTARETVAGTGNVSTSHTYAAEGKYKISLYPSDGCTLELGHGTSGGKPLGNTNPYYKYLYRVEIGKNVGTLLAYTFHDAIMEVITIPNGVTNIGTQVFAYNSFTKAVIFPKTLTNFSNASHTFYSSSGVRVVSIPNGVTALPHYFVNATKLRKICTPDTVTSYWANFVSDSTVVLYFGISKNVTSLGQRCAAATCVTEWKIPPSVNSIAAECFALNKSTKLYDFTEHTKVPTLENVNAFTEIPADCEIRVPAVLRDEWAAATNWATYASQIVAM